MPALTIGLWPLLICLAALRIQLVNKIATMRMPAINGSKSLSPRMIIILAWYRSRCNSRGVD